MKKKRQERYLLYDGRIDLQYNMTNPFQPSLSPISSTGCRPENVEQDFLRESSAFRISSTLVDRARSKQPTTTNNFYKPPILLHDLSTLHHPIQFPSQEAIGHRFDTNWI